MERPLHVEKEYCVRGYCFHISTSKNINENKGKVEEIENWSCQEGRPVEEREGEGRG